jgi:hypothetical protein
VRNGTENSAPNDAPNDDVFIRPTAQHRPPDPSAHHQKTTTTTTTNKKTTTTNNTNEWPGNLQCAVCGNNENSSEIAGF